MEKEYKNGSIGWKSFVLVFPLIENWLAWYVGNGKKVRLGEDPWIGVGDGYKLSCDTIEKLKRRKITSLNEAISQTSLAEGKTI